MNEKLLQESMYRLHPDAFEEFCQAYLSLVRDPLETPALYGVKGGSQKGVDIVYPREDSHGKRIQEAAQCKRYKTYGKSRIEKNLLRKLTYKADQFLLLTTARLNDESMDLLEANKWEFHGPDQIATELRTTISQDQGLQLLSEFFSPSDVLNITGKAEVSWLQSSQVHFERLAKNPFFNLNHSLVGRKDELEALHQAVKTGKRLIVLYGEGGIGKSRLLKAFAKGFYKKHNSRKKDSANHKTLRFIPNGVDIQQIQQPISGSKYVLVCDDAQNRGDLTTLLEHTNGTVIVSARPYSEPTIRYAIPMANLGSNQLADDIKLGPLILEEQESLIRTVLPDATPHTLAKLSNTAQGNTAVLVLIADKIKAQSWTSEKVLQDEDLRNLLRRLLRPSSHPELDGKSGKVNAILFAISLLMPLPGPDELGSFWKGFEETYGFNSGEPAEILHALRAVGLVVKETEGLVLIPDILADFCLEENIWDPSHQEKTPKLGRLLKICDAETMLRYTALTRLARLEAQQEAIAEGTFTNELWKQEKKRLLQENTREIQHFLKELHNVSPYVPQMSIDAAQLLLGSSELKQNIPIQRAIMDMLYRVAALRPEFTDACARILVELMDASCRETSSFAWKKISDLARYEKSRDVRVPEKAVQAIVELFNQGLLDDVEPSPLLILKQCFEVELEDTWYDRTSEHLYTETVRVSRERTQPVRDRVYDLLESILNGDDETHQVTALNLIFSARSMGLYPSGSLHRQAKAIAKEWAQERWRFLDLLDQWQPSSPTLIVQKSRMLVGACFTEPDGKRLATAMRRHVESVEHNLRLDLFLAVAGSSSILHSEFIALRKDPQREPFKNIEDDERNGEHESIWQIFLCEVAATFSSLSSVEQLQHLIEVSEQGESDWPKQYASLFSVIRENHPNEANELKLTLIESAQPWTACAITALHPMNDPQGLTEFFEACLEKDCAIHASTVLLGYADHLLHSEPTPKQLDLCLRAAREPRAINQLNNLFRRLLQKASPISEERAELLTGLLLEMHTDTASGLEGFAECFELPWFTEHALPALQRHKVRTLLNKAWQSLSTSEENLWPLDWDGLLSMASNNDPENLAEFLFEHADNPDFLNSGLLKCKNPRSDGMLKHPDLDSLYQQCWELFLQSEMDSIEGGQVIRICTAGFSPPFLDWIVKKKMGTLEDGTFKNLIWLFYSSYSGDRLLFVREKKFLSALLQEVEKRPKIKEQVISLIVFHSHPGSYGLSQGGPDTATAFHLKAYQDAVDEISREAGNPFIEKQMVNIYRRMEESLNASVEQMRIR